MVSHSVITALWITCGTAPTLLFIAFSTPWRGIAPTSVQAEYTTGWQIAR